LLDKRKKGIIKEGEENMLNKGKCGIIIKRIKRFI
jgi:hypothetical protein